MSGIYPTLQQEISGVDPLSIGGTALSHNAEALDSLAEALGLPTLMSFYSQSPEELAALLDDMEITIPNFEIPDEQWFETDKGLSTVRGLRDALLKNPSGIKDPSSVIDDLDLMEKVLEQASEHHVGFHLSVDY